MSVFIDEITRIFGEKGNLSKIEGFEFRDCQKIMAISVAENLENHSHTIIEAPTGVGKSIAYLIPSILYAKSQEKKAIISTATINLQEQLIKKDIPLIKSILPVDFKSEILKGRQNYICTKRLSRALAKHNDLFENEEFKLLQDIYDFVQINGIGEKQYLPFPQNTELWNKVWSEIYAETGICTSKSCGGEDTNCYYQQAKQKLKDADVIILNHYLFFTLFGFYERDSEGYLYMNDFAIFDEAHMIEQIAADNVSPSITKEQIKFWLYKLYNPKSGKGFLSNRGSERLTRQVTMLIQDNELFFSDLENFILNKYPNSRIKKEFRIREPLNFDQGFTDRIKELCNDLKTLASHAQNDDDANEIKNYWDHLNGFNNTIIDFTGLSHPEFIYWIEFSYKPRGNTKLCTSPVDMADYFRNNVFVDNRSSIMTSATLSINQTMDYFKSTVGGEKINSHILDSPFDYARQMKIYIPKMMPAPNVKKNYEDVSDILETGSSYEAELYNYIEQYIDKTNGGALVLFTNMKLLRKVYIALKPFLKSKNIDLFAQGSGLPRNKLLNNFKDDFNSVLFGVDSFWMGVDVPGESLRNVIITKLPFEVPDDPITEAKIERIKEQGGNPFNEFSLPWAILKFKQGAGRLIRNKTDEGILVVLDSRIINKYYGRYFISSLPECEVIIE